VVSVQWRSGELWMGISKFGDTRDHTTHTYADHPQIEDEHQRIAKSYPEGMAR
jgi:hypothetical protein